MKEEIGIEVERNVACKIGNKIYILKLNNKYNKKLIVTNKY